MSDFKTPSKYDVFDVTKNTDDLKKLIAEHPDYPIVVLAGEEANSGDYYWMYCSDIRFGLGEILTVQAPYNDEIVCGDRDSFEEEMSDWLFYKLEGDGVDVDNMPDEEYEKILKEEIAKYEPYWKKVIAIWATN